MQYRDAGRGDGMSVDQTAIVRGKLHDEGTVSVSLGFLCLLWKFTSIVST